MKHLNVLVLGADSYDPLLRVMELLTHAESTVTLNPHVVILEGESADRLKAHAPSCTCEFLPNPTHVDTRAVKEFRRAKRWVREYLGDRALEGYNMGALFPALTHQEMLKKLVTYIRGKAAANTEASFLQEQTHSAEWKALHTELTQVGCQSAHLDKLLAYLERYPQLGRLTPWDDTINAFGIRPSEYLMHIDPRCKLLPQRWQHVDWILLHVENRNSQDLLNRCIVPHDNIPASLPSYTERTVILMQWPHPWAGHPLYGQGWEEMAFSRELKNLRERLRSNSRFQGAFIHFSAPTHPLATSAPTTQRHTEIADFMELLAYWRAAKHGQDWNELMMPEGGGKRSVILGIARAIVEPPHFLARSLKPGDKSLQLIATLEQGTEWNLKTLPWEVTVGGWSLSPDVWSAEIKAGSPHVTIQTRLFVGENIAKEIEKAEWELEWKPGQHAMKLGFPSGKVGLAGHISLPYLNLIALMVIVIVEGDIPLTEPNTEEELLVTTA